MKQLINKIKIKLSGLKNRYGKKFEITLALLLSMIVLAIFMSSMKSKGKEENQNELVVMEKQDYIDKTEQRLQTILASVKGAGKVKVFISASSTSEIIYLKEDDIKSNGSTNAIITESSTVVFSKINGEQVPIARMEIYPKIDGVLIVAEGAVNEKVKLNLINAASVALNLEISKIEVLAAEKQ